MYLTEMAPLHLRGAMGVLCALGVTFGVLVGQVMSLREILGTEETWEECLSFFVLLVIICASALPFFPESPKYLYVIKKQHHLALRGKNFYLIQNITKVFQVKSSESRNPILPDFPESVFFINC